VARLVIKRLGSATSIAAPRNTLTPPNAPAEPDYPMASNVETPNPAAASDAAVSTAR
jgi:hypothetical protein